VLDPIIITGIPRSRTSMTTQILELCGMFLGEVMQGCRANPQGQKENRKIVDTIIKPHLKRHRFDPKGQNPLPPVGWYIPDPKRKQKTLDIMKSQDLKEGMIWGFKDHKPCLDWRNWHKAFPNAYWIVPVRKDEDVINSCLRTSFMSRYKDKKGWQHFIDEHKVRFEDMFKNLERIKKLNTDEVVNYNFDTLKEIVDELGLNWDYDKVHAQIQPIN
jgi:hypothetical protein